MLCLKSVKLPVIFKIDNFEFLNSFQQSHPNEIQAFGHWIYSILLVQLTNITWVKLRKMLLNCSFAQRCSKQGICRMRNCAKDVLLKTCLRNHYHQSKIMKSTSCLLAALQHGSSPPTFILVLIMTEAGEEHQGDGGQVGVGLSCSEHRLRCRPMRALNVECLSISRRGEGVYGGNEKH